MSDSPPLSTESDLGCFQSRSEDTDDETQTSTTLHWDMNGRVCDETVTVRQTSTKGNSLVSHLRETETGALHRDLTACL